MLMYFVSWYIHNKTDNEWNATVVDKYSSLSTAKKEYHRQLSMYIDSEDFDTGVVMLTDSIGNNIMSEMWTKETEPVSE